MGDHPPGGPLTPPRTDQPDATDARRVVRVYMGDHLTVMRAGGRLTGRMLAADVHFRNADDVRAAATAFEDGCRTLSALLRQLGASPPRSKMLAGSVAELLGRAKLNGRLRGPSPLSEVLELQALMAALALTAAGWRGLQAAGIAAEEVVAPHAEAAEELCDRIADDAREAAGRVLDVATGPVPA